LRPSRRLELGRVLFLFHVGTDLSALSDLLPDLFGGLGGFLVCWSMQDMIVEIFINTTSYSAGLANPFFFATISTCASIFASVCQTSCHRKLYYLLVGGDEALNLLLGEFDLLYLMGGGHAGIK
jgi:hypothetical protein